MKTRHALINSIRAASISFIILLAVNISVFHHENVKNFIMILFITIINAYMIGMSVFFLSLSKRLKHLKNVAILLVLFTVIIFSYLEYPIITNITKTQKADIGFGNIEFIEDNNTKKKEDIVISIG